jgi:hypothetical protein
MANGIVGKPDGLPVKAVIQLVKGFACHGLVAKGAEKVHGIGDGIIGDQAPESQGNGVNGVMVGTAGACHGIERLQSAAVWSFTAAQALIAAVTIV